MNLTSVIVLGAIMVFFAWRSAKQEGGDRKTTLRNLTPSFERGSGFWELILFLSYLLLYKLSRAFAIGDETTAFDNAYRVVEWEKQLGIFYEIQWQQYFLQHPVLVQVLNQIYMKMHLPATIIFFVWLFQRRKKEYIFIRNGFMVANIITIFFFIYFPCAPPRMLNDIGFVDTLLEISNINLYKGNLSKMFNQYAAMPSMHFGYALLIAVITVWLERKYMWLKWGIIIYPFFILLIIVITGNHYFLDAALGGFLALMPYPIMLLLEKQWPSLKPWFWGKPN